METVYPAGPTNVPANLTEPTSKYRSRAWLATGGLVAFTLLYFVLTGWFGWTAWRLFRAALNGQVDTLWGWVAAFGAAFLALFMLKALFFVKHRYAIDAVEIKRDEQPKLFEFLQRLADDAGAPRAHRVFVSGRVNAAVFYDLSLLNLVVPSKKNLEIGLALVNGLTLGELKAVLAHEFGHFAQRSMAVGRWVYVAQQIAGQIIARRDALDKFLNGLSRFDLRVAWIGWVLWLVVWSLRSLTETAFRVVLIAQRALSREMEFQADLVAVSLTGSDALIHALHKIGAAEYAWDRAVNFAAGEAQAGRLVRDVLTLQTDITQRMRDLLGDPTYGTVAAVPRERPETHRIFKQQLAQAPRMWSTHPSNNEREENAKRTYVPASIDERSAWEVFENATALRERISAALFRAPEAAKVVPIEESQQRLHLQYQRTYLDPQYRGAYLGRSIVRHATRADELYDAAAGDLVAAQLSSLYPEPLAAELTLLREIEIERGALRALRDGFLEAPGGVIQHRGRELKRRDLPKVIEGLEAELAAVQARVREHDRRCRTAHLAVAKQVGAGWPEYLSGLLAVVHYTDHAEADLLDAHGAFRNVFAIVTADGRVSNRELKRLLAACQQAWTPLQRIFEQAADLALDARLRERLAIESWAAAIGKLKLVPPTEQNLGDWLGAIDGWVGHAAASLSTLRLTALDELLLAERRVAALLRESTAPPSAPEPSRAPREYPVLLPGAERPLQRRLGLWDRFQLADGAWATAARLVVAVTIVGAIMGVGGMIGESTLAVFNSFDRPVRVAINATTFEVAPFSVTSTTLPPGSDAVRVTTTFLDGTAIETFEEQARSFANVVYNVAGAAPLLEWVTSGNRATSRRVGAARWTTSAEAGMSSSPPGTVTESGELSGPGRAAPQAWLGLIDDDAERGRVIAAHARHDGPDGRYLQTWLRLAAERGELAAIAKARLAANPHDIMTMYVEQSVTTGDEHAAVCERQTALARANRDDGDYRFLAVRCMSDLAARNQAFAENFKAYPDNGWLAFAVGSDFAARARWQDAVAALEITRRSVPPLAEDAALTLARVRRMTADDAALSDLARDSAAVQFFTNIELGSSRQPVDQAYNDLHRGNLEAAVKRTLPAPVAARVLRLAAASDGAPDELVRRSRQLAIDEGLDAGTGFAAIGLALRDDASSEEIAELLRRLSPAQADSLSTLVEAVRQRNFRRVDQMLEVADVAMRGYLYSMATVALGEDTPSTWREGARRLLFAPERPHFAPSNGAAAAR